MTYPTTLLGKVATRPNLQKAWEEISRHAKPFSHGISAQTILDFRSNSLKELAIIRDQILNHNYVFGNYRAVTIQKSKKKKRPLQIADIRDRVVQRAIAQVIDKPLSEKFHLKNDVSHAYLRKKSVQTALLSMIENYEKGCNTVVEADIIDFFSNIDKEKLLNEMVFPSLSDPTLNTLLNDALNIEIGNRYDLPEEDWELYPESACGLPQGGYLSPLLSNIYLSQFDHKMIKAKFNLIRYADDFIIMCESPEKAEEAYQKSLEILETELKLTLHERNDNDPKSKTRIFKISGKKPLYFLGIKFNGKNLEPDGKKRQKLTYKMNTLRSKSNVRELLNSANNLLVGWISAYSFTDLNKTYCEKIDSELNSYLWFTLKKLGWKLDPKNLNQSQRISSGILPSYTYLARNRRNMSEKARVSFSKYWST